MGTSAPLRKAIGRLIGVCIIAGAVVAIALTVWQWQVHPRQTTPRCGPILSAWLRRSAAILSSYLCRTTSSCTRAICCS